MGKHNGLICALFVSVAVLAAAPPADAAPITYSEKIEDLNFATFLDLFDATRNLTRTRTFGDGTPNDVETNEPDIVSENVLSDNWGFSTAVAMSWEHVFPSVSSVDTYLQGKLTLEMVGVNSAFDSVFVEFFNVGPLIVGGTDTQSTTTFSTDGLPDPDAVISFFLADGKLDVRVRPLFDFMTIRSSTMEVTYEPVAVPEPTTAVLVLSGIAAGAWRRHASRRRRLPRPFQRAPSES
jgi:hypothetical protein